MGMVSNMSRRYGMDKQRMRLYFAVTVIGLILIVAARLVFKPEIFGDVWRTFIRIFSFLIWAIAIAYFLNPIMMWLEHLFKFKKGKRVLSMVIVYVLFLGVAAFFGALVVPLVVSNVTSLINNASQYIQRADAWLQEVLKTPWLQDIGAPDVVYGWLEDLRKYVTDNLPNWAEATARGAFGFGRGFMQFLLGTILSVYILRDRERMLQGMKRLNYAVFKPARADLVATSATRVNLIFKRFILGKTFDSIIIGAVSYVALLIIGAPLALLQSVIILVTNMIPTIGPIIGAVPCLLISVLVDPTKALWVLIYLIVIQQVDGLYLGPKILGGVLKMSPFYIIAGVLIGGGFFGIPGMFLGVPLLAAIKAFLDEYVDNRLKERGVELTK
jgi:predicted PurR-regulated permease PerM